MKTFKPKLPKKLGATMLLTKPKNQKERLNNLERVRSEQEILELELDRLIEEQSKLLKKQDELIEKLSLTQKVLSK